MKETASRPPVARHWPNHHHHHRFRCRLIKFTKPIAYLMLLLLSYSLGGYMSAVVKPQPDTPRLSPVVAPLIPAAKTDILPSVQNNITGDDDEEKPQPIQLLKLQKNKNDHVNRDSDIKLDDHYVFGTVCADPITAAGRNNYSQLVRRTIIDRVFDGVSPWKNFPPPHVAKLLSPSKVRGWGSTGVVFRNLILKVKPAVIIEVGTFLGASALHMVALTRELGLRETQILCVDDFRGWPGFQRGRRLVRSVNGDVTLLHQFMQNVAQANATESVVFMPFSTGSALEMLCSWGLYGDLIEVDAGHDFHSAWSDINRAYKILRPGGILFGHDYLTGADKKGVRRAVDLFARVKNLRVRVDGQHWVLYDTKLNHSSSPTSKSVN